MVITPPTGTRDFGPYDCQVRKKIFEKLCYVAGKHAFHPIETPAIERIEVMQGKYGEEGEKLFFKILKRGDQANKGECDLALRYDLTVPAMRYYVANKKQLPKIFKRYQYGPVWRAERPGKDRYRQFYQFDFDIYGSAAISADIECMNVLVDCLNSLSINDFYIRLNSRKLLYALMREYHIPESLHQVIITLIDKVDKIGIEGLNESLNPYKEIGRINDFAQTFMNPNYNIIFLDVLGSDEKNNELLNELMTIMDMSKNFIDPSKIKIDMTLARGIDYYNGPIFEIEIPTIKGSIAAGGRYNNLSKLFTSEEVPVCGASLGIDRIIPLVGIDTLDIKSILDIYISNDSDELSGIYELSLKLRNLGYSVEIQRGASGKFRKELSYANHIKANYFIYQGESERKDSTFFLKDMYQASIEGSFFCEQVVNFFEKLALKPASPTACTNVSINK